VMLCYVQSCDEWSVDLQNTNRSAVELWAGLSLSGNRCLSMRDCSSRTRLAGSVVGSVYAVRFLGPHFWLQKVFQCKGWFS